MKIKEATIKDFDELLKLKLESKKEERKLNRELTPVEKVKKYYEEYLRNDLKSKWRAVFVAVENGNIIGVITGKTYRTLYIAGYKRVGHISNLFVSKEFRKKAVAQKLIKEVVKWFKKKKAVEIGLELYEHNVPAINLYHKLGFKNYSVKMRKKI